MHRLILALVVLGLAAETAPAAAQTTTFTTAGEHPYVVPTGVSTLKVELVGGRGGVGSRGTAGGAGALVTAELTVTPGETLTAVVGGNAAAEVPGANGGGVPTPASGPAPDRPGGGGGGASDLRRAGERLLVAGGGGGGPATGAGTGGAAGAPGTGQQPRNGGRPGTSIGPGAGGEPGGSTGDGPVGGRSGLIELRNGNTGVVTRLSGGAGGGGLFGGGGGSGSDGGGGGGSSLAGGGTVAIDGTGVPLVAITPGPAAPAPPPADPGQPAADPGRPATTPPADTTAPVLRGVELRATRFRIGKRPKGGSRGVPRGSAITLAVAEPGSARLTVDRLRPGRRVGAACRAPSRATRRRTACTRVSRVGTAEVPLAAGLQTLALPTTYPGGKLTPGRFRLTLVVTDAAGNRSAPERVPFRVVR